MRNALAQRTSCSLTAASSYVVRDQVETVAEANQVVFFNENEPYRVSHPVGGGDADL